MAYCVKATVCLAHEWWRMLITESKQHPTLAADHFSLTFLLLFQSTQKKFQNFINHHTFNFYLIFYCSSEHSFSHCGFQEDRLDNSITSFEILDPSDASFSVRFLTSLTQATKRQTLRPIRDSISQR